MTVRLHAAARVDIFLRSEARKKYNLKPQEVLILLTIANRIGLDDDAWPSITYIVTYTGFCKSTVIRSIKSLINQSLITKTSTKMNNHYCLCLPDTNLCPTDTSSSITSVPQTPTGVSETPPSVPQTPGWCPTDTHIVSIETQLETQREREPLPLIENLQPTQEQIDRCSKEGIDLKGEEMKFKANAKSKGLQFVDWNAAFELWLTRARPIISVTGETFRQSPRPNEPRCALQFFDQKSKIHDNGKLEDLDPLMRERIAELISKSH